MLVLAGCERELPPEQARELLQRVHTARRTLSLTGKLTTSIQMQGRALRADARMQRAPGIIHLTYTSGRFAGWKLIEQDGLVWRISPQGKPEASPISPETGMGLPSHPGLSIRDGGLVRRAGRTARRYIVQPPGEDTDARLVIAVDSKTGYPLSIQRYGHGGTLVSATVYHQINYGTPPPERVKPPAEAKAWNQRRPGGSARKMTEQELEKAVGWKLLKPAYVPEGFQLRGHFLRETRRATLAEMRYSDGLRTLVVSQGKTPQRPPDATPGAAAGQRPRGFAEGRPQVGRRQPEKQTPQAQPPQGAPRQSEGGPWDRRGGWWQRFSQDRSARGMGPGGRRVLRERRGDRMIIVSGDLSSEELRKVLASIPQPEAPKADTKF